MKRNNTLGFGISSRVVLQLSVKSMLWLNNAAMNVITAYISISPRVVGTLHNLMNDCDEHLPILRKWHAVHQLYFLLCQLRNLKRSTMRFLRSHGDYMTFTPDLLDVSICWPVDASFD